MNEFPTIGNRHGVGIYSTWFCTRDKMNCRRILRFKTCNKGSTRCRHVWKEGLRKSTYITLLGNANTRISLATHYSVQYLTIYVVSRCNVISSRVAHGWMVVYNLLRKYRLPVQQYLLVTLFKISCLELPIRCGCVVPQARKRK